MLPAIIDFVLQRMVQGGAVIRLEHIGPDPPDPPPSASVNDAAMPEPIKNGVSTKGAPPSPDNDSWRKQMGIVLRPKIIGHWPIPEAYWPIYEIMAIPPRSPHPLLHFQYDPVSPDVTKICKEFPIDKYELCACPLTEYILSRKEPDECWKVYIPNSSRANGVGHPFGYIKASLAHQRVSLYILPYNYPKLLPLIEEAKQTPSSTTSGSFRQRFDEYLSTVPTYYYSVFGHSSMPFPILFQLVCLHILSGWQGR